MWGGRVVTTYCSWVEGFWDAMYLEARSSVPCDWNPSFVLRDDPAAAGPLPRYERASRFIYQGFFLLYLGLRGNATSSLF